MCRNSKKKRLENRTNFYQKFLKKTSEISEKNLKSEQSEKIVYWVTVKKSTHTPPRMSVGNFEFGTK